jgi:hypothetical protein
MKRELRLTTNLNLESIYNTLEDILRQAQDERVENKIKVNNSHAKITYWRPDGRQIT